MLGNENVEEEGRILAYVGTFCLLNSKKKHRGLYMLMRKKVALE
jgi:hypothetical protein